ncbi:MAG: TolC family protein [Planctomycetes bacterium]|nr:TolC family protein [Planctomycetota bacterium]
MPVPPETIPLEQTGGRPFDLRDGWNLYELQVVALYNNPDLKAERDNIGVAEGLLVSAGKIPNPVITDSTFLAPLGSGAASLAMNIAEPILTAGKRRIAREGASVEINRVRAAIESREWDVTREIKARYWRLQYLDERLRLEQENIGLSERSLSIAQARLDAGDATPLDVELAASDLGTRRSRQQTLLSEKAVGTQELARLLGLPPSISFTWEKRENLYGEAARVPSPRELETLALSGRPDLKEALERYQVAEKSLELAHAGAYPDVDVGPGIEKAGGESTKVGVFLGIPIPLFYRNQGEIAQRVAERDRVGHEVESLLVQAKQEIQSAASQISSFENAARVYGSEVLPKLESAVSRTQEAYRAGQVGAIELLSVQQGLVRARTEAIDLFSARQAAVVALEKAVGSELTAEVPP